MRFTVGGLGTFDFPAGCYVYTGSPKRNLHARVARHHSRGKRLRWHIDYLLAAISATGDSESPREASRAASCSYRIAFGARAGQKVLSLRTVAGSDDDSGNAGLCAQAHGFGPHAVVCTAAQQRKELERLCR